MIDIISELKSVEDDLKQTLYLADDIQSALKKLDVTQMSEDNAEWIEAIKETIQQIKDIWKYE